MQLHALPQHHAAAFHLARLGLVREQTVQRGDAGLPGQLQGGSDQRRAVSAEPASRRGPATGVNGTR